MKDNKAGTGLLNFSELKTDFQGYQLQMGFKIYAKVLLIAFEEFSKMVRIIQVNNEVHELNAGACHHAKLRIAHIVPFKFKIIF